VELQILFYKGNGLVSRVIKRTTRSEYSHVALQLNELHIIETDYKSPLLITHRYWTNTEYDAYRVELTATQKKLIRDYMYARLGSRYDFLHFFSRFFNTVFGTRVIKRKGRFNCDEIIYEAFLYAGIDLLDGRALTPDALARSPHLRKVHVPKP
jgi:uncharacterized protein YycO